MEVNPFFTASIAHSSNQFTDKELPDPPAGTQLKYIALGFGIQNYTCEAVGKDSSAAGALAMLYDVTKLYPGRRPGSLSHAEFEALPANILQHHAVPINFDTTTTEGRADPSIPGASQTHPFPADEPLRVRGMRPLPFLGHHFFDAAGVPVFDIYKGSNGDIHLPCKKVDSANAPESASKGPDGTGAVSWLLLDDKGGATGAKYVYRVLTAGGNSHGCSKGTGGDTTSYAATYWFYG